MIPHNFLYESVSGALGQIYAVASLSAEGTLLADIGNALPRIDEGVVEMIKTIALMASVLFVGGIAWILARLRTLSVPAPVPTLTEEINPPPSAGPGPWGARWGEIMRHLDSAKEESWKFAVIEADALVDRVLARSGFPGSTLGERLMNIQPGQLVGLESLWAAHKVRNTVAHQPDYFLRYTEAKQAIAVYEAVLRELNAL